MSVHVNFDDAWDSSRVPMRTLDARGWGPRLRYAASRREISRAFAELGPKIPRERFVLYGSGDFHHLAAWWLARALERTGSAAQKAVLVCFDTHPDWDVRWPRWACGGWVNRALEMEPVAKASVWGCGNFELEFPSRLFRNRRAMKSGRLEIHAWAERQHPRVAKMFDCMTRENWQARFERFARSLAGAAVYVSVDLDCLQAADAVTNWEHGLFAVKDLAWAVAELRDRARVIGGDVCGAYSEPVYARRWQRFIAEWDHPKLARKLEEAREVNHRTLGRVWPALSGDKVTR